MPCSGCLIPFAQEYKDKDKLADIVFDLISSDDYGCRSGLIDHVADILPGELIQNLIKRPMDRYLYQALFLPLVMLLNTKRF